MRSILSTFLFCLAGILPGWAQQADPLTYSVSLQEAIEYAQTHQTSVQNSLIDVEIAKNDVKRIIGIGLPQVSGNASFSDYVKIPTSLLPGEFFGQPGVQVPVQFGVKYQSSAGLELNQLLLDGT
jgi:outer membrane protein